MRKEILLIKNKLLLRSFLVTFFLIFVFASYSYALSVTFQSNGLPSGIIINVNYNLSDGNAGATSFTTPNTVSVDGGPGVNVTTYTFSNPTGYTHTAARSGNVVTATYTCVQPSITCPGTITQNTDAGVCAASVYFAATSSSTLSYKIGETTITSPHTFPKGTTSVTATATNFCGSVSCTFDVVVVDAEDPVVTCPTDVAESYDSDEGFCYAALTFEATATDNCDTDVDIEYFIVVDEQPDVEITTWPYNFPVGTTTIKAVATDDADNTDECTFDVVVVDAEEPEVTCPDDIEVSNDEGECGAEVEFVATAADNCSDDEDITIAYYTDYDSDEEAEVSSGDLFPIGSTTVTVVATDESGNSSTCTFDIVVTNLVCAEYTGVAVASSTGSTATVLLAATVYDPDGCSLAGLEVEFTIGSSTYTAALGLVNNDPSLAVASIEVVVPIPNTGYDTYHVDFEIKGSPYIIIDSDCSSTDSFVTVYKADLTDFITGGGYLILENSSGIKAGDPGTKNNFGFNVKWNKSGKNLQGNINTIIRRREADGFIHTWQAKGNVMSSLTVSGNSAVFTGKASLQDVSDYPIVQLEGDGNATIRVEMTDNGEPGADLDVLAFTVYNKAGGVWFSSNWDGIKTIPQTIANGNLKVSSRTGLKSADIFVQDGETKSGEMKVYPNPFSSRVFIEFTPVSNADARLEMFDMRGAKVATVFNSRVEAGQFYRLDYSPVNVSSGMLMYRLTIGGEVTHGKVLFKK